MNKILAITMLSIFLFSFVSAVEVVKQETTLREDLKELQTRFLLLAFNPSIDSILEFIDLLGEARVKATKLEQELKREKEKRFFCGGSNTIYVPTPLSKLNQYDVNSDGYLNSADIDYMTDCLNGLITKEECLSCDLDGNGGVEPSDMARLINYLNEN